MSLRNIAGLYLVRLRGRLGQELLALLGIAVGVSLLFAALVANSSLTGSFDRLTRGVVGKASLQLTARGSDTLDERLVRDVQALPSVAAAAPVLDVRAEARGVAGRRASVLLIGATPDLASLGAAFADGVSYRFLADVRAVGTPEPVAHRLGVALGGAVTITTGARRVQARLGAKLLRSDVGALASAAVMVAPLDYAQELIGKPDRINRIIVAPVAGRDAQAARDLEHIGADRADVRPADFDGQLFRQASLPTNQSTAMFSMFGALVGFLFAFSAMLLTVPQRRRLIVDLDLEGYRRRTIVKVLLFDAVALGLTASVLGILLGDQVARRLFDDAPGFLLYAFPVATERIVPVRDLVLAVGGGVVASCIAVIAPTLGHMRERGRASDSESGGAHPPANRLLGAVLAGLLCLAAGVATVVAAPTSAVLSIAGLAALTASMLLLLPPALRLSGTLLEAVTQDVRSVVPFLVGFELRDRAAMARSLAVAATGAVAVFASVALQGAHADLLRGLDRTSQDVVAMGDLWAVAPGESNLLMTTPFPLPTIGPTSELAAVRPYRGGFLDVGDRRAWVFGPDPAGPLPLSATQVLAGDLRSAIARMRSGGWTVVSESIARDQDLTIGDRVRLPTPVPVTLRVAAISTNMGWPPGALIINGHDYARAWASDEPSAVVADLAPGVSPEAGRAALRAQLGDAVDVQTAEEKAAAHDGAARDGVARLAQIAALVLVSAVLAMASTMAGLLWQRRGFLAGVKVDGCRTSELWAALLLEALILIGVGCVLGAAFGLLGQSLLSRALTSVTGFPVVYATAASGAVLTTVAVTAAAVTIVGVVGRRVADVHAEAGLTG